MLGYLFGVNPKVEKMRYVCVPSIVKGAVSNFEFFEDRCPVSLMKVILINSEPFYRGKKRSFGVYIR